MGLIGFIWRQLAVTLPILDLSLLKQRRFAVGTLFNFILGFGLFGSVFIIPVFCCSSAFVLICRPSTLLPGNPLSAERIREYTKSFLSKEDKGAALMTATGKAYGVMQGTVVKQALVMTYADSFLVIGAFFLVCVPLLLLFIGKKIQTSEHTELVME